MLNVVLFVLVAGAVLLALVTDLVVVLSWLHRRQRQRPGWDIVSWFIGGCRWLGSERRSDERSNWPNTGGNARKRGGGTR